MSEASIEPMADKTFGAVVRDVALGRLSASEFSRIHEAFLTYGFLVFPEQYLSDEEQVAFGRRFGELEFGAVALSNQERQKDGSLGKLYDLDHTRMRIMIGNEGWHTDSTYHPISSKCALLSAIKVPEEGGETQLADARAGYAALDPVIQDRISGLSAYHSLLYSQANDLGHFPPESEGTIFHGEAYLRPLVKVHPETGVKNLMIGRHAFGIPGLIREESRALLQWLLDFVVSEPTRVFSHRWRPGDTLLWDNRALLHQARPYDYRQPRVLIGTRVTGEPPSELAYFPSDPRAEDGRRALAAELALLRAAQAAPAET
ncbi:MAG: TauD/TfdA family dioxygenase [Gammaproteobacteria bacterium]|nr:TauD/TfdA family dioxygenase [Gammaproteobacteria bacterium]